MKRIALALILSMLALLLLGCGSPSTSGEAEPPAEASEGSDDFPARDANAPLSVGEQGTIILGNTQQAEIQVLRPNGELLYELPIKPNSVIDPNVAFTIQAMEAGLPEDLADQYAAVGSTVLELHAVDESGYGFALRPQLTIHYTEEELNAARVQGAALEPLKGNLVVLYKEQRSPRWVPQTDVMLNEQERTVAVSNIAGAGAWRLAAKK